MIEDPQRHWERYFQVMSRHRTPEQVEETFEKIGNHAEVLLAIEAFQDRWERWEWSARFWKRAREVLIIVGLTGGVFAAIAAALSLADRLRIFWQG